MLPYGAARLAASFRAVRNHTIRIAEDIPEEQYGFVAAAGTWPVGQLLAHMALIPRITHKVHGVEHRTTLAGFDYFGLRSALLAEQAKPRSKAEVIELLRSEGERFADWLASLSDEMLAEQVTDPSGKNPQPRLEMLRGAKEHEMHHRGQLMLIERMLGVVPHLTRVMDARAEQVRLAAIPETRR
jgi:uncharacterized damage-inducible protein DinB